MEFPAAPASLPLPTDATEEIYPISVTKFVWLCLATFGLYGLWWQYKAWRFFKYRQQLDIWPVARTLFSLFYVYGLMTEISRFARTTGHAPTYSASSLTAGYVILSLLSRLPEPFWLASLGAFVFLIAPFDALRIALLNSPEYAGGEQEKFNTRQRVLLVLGAVFWLLLVAGLLLQE